MEYTAPDKQASPSATVATNMFGLFTSKCPIPEESRRWVERRFAWARSTFHGRVLHQVILPTPEFFPDEYDASDEAAKIMFNRVCKYMAVNQNRVQLRLVSARIPSPDGMLVIQNGSRAAGTYQPSDGIEIITIERSYLEKPMTLVATMAHELCHVHLLGDGNVTRDTEDHEPLTDLLTVCMGMGIFGANASAQYSAWSKNGWSGWETSSLGYLRQDTWGYALSLFAHFRSETRPIWAKHLRADVRSILSKSLRYLSGRSKQAD
jgi:hypothetical protein